MSDLLLFHGEIALLSAGLCALHALRPRLGLHPLLVATGLLLGFMLIGARLSVPAPVIGGATVRYASLALLPLLLVAVALVYTLEGTVEARRLVSGIVIGKILVNLLKALLAWRLVADPELVAKVGGERWLDVRLGSSAASTAAILAACTLLVVVYQALLNFRRVPLLVALWLALAAAMLADGVVYAALSGKLDRIDWHLVGKLSAGVAVALPASLYIVRELRKSPDDVRRGVRERGAFELVDLRRRVARLREQLDLRGAELAHIKHVFGRYVVPDVVEELLADAGQLELGGEVREVTVLFADIRGYSTLSEAMSPTDTIRLLNDYFGAMSRVLDRHRGTIIEFEGDAILAVFGAPLRQADHAARATRAAAEMQDAVRRQNEVWDRDGTARHWQQLGLQRFQIRVGVHTGTVVVGNVGSETRTKYAVIGDTVNIASRIEQMNKTLRTGVLLSRATVDSLGSDAPPLRSLGEQSVRGRRESVEVFTFAGEEEGAA